ncbi:hypothetical protein GGX14DRAFT_673680 [Mycena pura]|uniref:Uncharacterized protein n=1 Tax=Mycena pura TaxID=153505 RepID=A0AAD6UZJ3_9AGAR|nr:hypothetical protein GGX14DRAFT_673680 [Mycena pura]
MDLSFQLCDFESLKQPAPRVLRNFTRQQYVRESAIDLRNEYNNTGFGEVVLSRICLSSNPSTSMGYAGDIHRGISGPGIALTLSLRSPIIHTQAGNTSQTARLSRRALQIRPAADADAASPAKSFSTTVRPRSLRDKYRETGVPMKDIVFGEVVFSRICFSTDPSVSTSYRDEGEIHWTGDRFDIISAEWLKELETGVVSGAGWTDVSDEVLREVEEIWDANSECRPTTNNWYISVEDRPNNLK